jgi:hypothetical protein
MAPLYDRPVRELMREMVGELGLRTGEVLTRDEVFEWFRSRYPLVKEGTVAAHLLRMSTNAPSRLHHTLRADGSDDLFFQIDARRFRLYDRAQDPTLGLSGCKGMVLNSSPFRVLGKRGVTVHAGCACRANPAILGGL